MIRAHGGEAPGYIIRAHGGEAPGYMIRAYGGEAPELTKPYLSAHSYFIPKFRKVNSNF
jgi:hypothetical protein